MASVLSFSRRDWNEFNLQSIVQNSLTYFLDLLSLLSWFCKVKLIGYQSVWKILCKKSRNHIHTDCGVCVCTVRQEEWDSAGQWEFCRAVELGLWSALGILPWSGIGNSDGEWIWYSIGQWELEFCKAVGMLPGSGVGIFARKWSGIGHHFIPLIGTQWNTCTKILIILTNWITFNRISLMFFFFKTHHLS